MVCKNRGIDGFLGTSWVPITRPVAPRNINAGIMFIGHGIGRGVKPTIDTHCIFSKSVFV